MNDKAPKRPQISFDVPLDLKIEIKVLAARRNISQSLWINRAIIEYIKKEKQYDLNNK